MIDRKKKETKKTVNRKQEIRNGKQETRNGKQNLKKLEEEKRNSNKRRCV